MWEGGAGEKAGDREHGAGGCSDDRDIEAWGWREFRRPGDKDSLITGRDGVTSISP